MKTQGKRPSITGAVRCGEYEHSVIREAFEALLPMAIPDFYSLIKPGDRIIVKPYLRDRGTRGNAVSERRVSHPVLVAALVELLRDCGANIILGDVGAFDSENAKPNEPNYWLAELKRRYGVRLVDFAAAGARMMKAGVYYPRDYLITNALIDTDLVINCANCQPHFRLFLNGAVRNMFNGLVGHCQDHIYEVFKSNRRLSRVIADVCRVIRPSVSVLDMISVREANSDTGLRNV